MAPDLGFASQNLERLRLTRKILRNKDLAQRPPKMAATPLGCGDDRISVLWKARSDVTRAEDGAVDKFLFQPSVLVWGWRMEMGSVPSVPIFRQRVR